MEQEIILVAEREQTLRETIAYHLRREGYVVLMAADGMTTVEMSRQYPLDLVLLDFLLPELQSADVCRQLRAKPQTALLPIILLLPRQMDLLSKEDFGVTDMLAKPFSWKELRALVWAALRRSERAQRVRRLREATLPEEEQVFVVGNLRIDGARREVTKSGQKMDLKTRLFDLLVYLVRYPDEVLTYERLLSHVWGATVKENSTTLYVHIHWLREKFEDDPAHPHLIETVRGVGYRFNPAAASEQRGGQ